VSRVFNNNAVCSCIEDFIGTPPNCRPECSHNSDCLPRLACQNQHCMDPCPGTCGFNALCHVVNHAPICSCPPRHNGNPFLGCFPEPVRRDEIIPKHPCQPSPCGPYAKCTAVGDQAQCSCLAEYIGTPPNCRPECVTNSECSFDKACLNQRCRDPCPGNCGSNANCHVISHAAMCYCLPGYTGDPFTSCRQVPLIQHEEIIQPCSPSPCGANAVCRQEGNVGSCQCLPEYYGNPYEICRPECVTNNDCPAHKSCQQNKCRDPCPGVCALNALCRVINHLPTCHCHNGFVGDPYRYCQIPEKRESSTDSDVLSKANQYPPLPLAILKEYVNPCQPSPCGPNSQCRENNEQAICSCLPEYVGAPPNCRPECVTSAECPQDKACVRQKCSDPCQDVCGSNADCRVIQHAPICSCRPGFTGDAFSRCLPMPRKIFPYRMHHTIWLTFLHPTYSPKTTTVRRLPKSLCTLTLWPVCRVPGKSGNCHLQLSALLLWHSAQLSPRVYHKPRLSGPPCLPTTALSRSLSRSLWL